jgi:hypothetical protein
MLVYLFSDLTILGITLPVEGAAIFTSDPGRGRPENHRPAILLEGYEPGVDHPPKAKHLSLSVEPAGRGQVTALTALLYEAVLAFLVAERWTLICREWEDEAPDRREDVRAAAGDLAHDMRTAA